MSNAISVNANATEAIECLMVMSGGFQGMPWNDRQETRPEPEVWSVHSSSDDEEEGDDLADGDSIAETIESAPACELVEDEEGDDDEAVSEVINVVTPMKTSKTSMAANTTKRDTDHAGAKDPEQLTRFNKASAATDGSADSLSSRTDRSIPTKNTRSTMAPSPGRPGISKPSRKTLNKHDSQNNPIKRSVASKQECLVEPLEGNVPPAKGSESLETKNDSTSDDTRDSEKPDLDQYKAPAAKAANERLPPGPLSAVSNSDEESSKVAKTMAEHASNASNSDDEDDRKPAAKTEEELLAAQYVEEVEVTLGELGFTFSEHDNGKANSKKCGIAAAAAARDQHAARRPHQNVAGGKIRKLASIKTPGDLGVSLFGWRQSHASTDMLDTVRWAKSVRRYDERNMCILPADTGNCQDRDGRHAESVEMFPLVGFQWNPARGVYMRDDRKSKPPDGPTDKPAVIKPKRKYQQRKDNVQRESMFTQAKMAKPYATDAIRVAENDGRLRLMDEGRTLVLKPKRDCKLKRRSDGTYSQPKKLPKGFVWDKKRRHALFLNFDPKVHLERSADDDQSKRPRPYNRNAVNEKLISSPDAVILEESEAVASDPDANERSDEDSLYRLSTNQTTNISKPGFKRHQSKPSPRTRLSTAEMNSMPTRSARDRNVSVPPETRSFSLAKRRENQHLEACRLTGDGDSTQSPACDEDDEPFEPHSSKTQNRISSNSSSKSSPCSLRRQTESLKRGKASSLAASKAVTSPAKRHKKNAKETVADASHQGEDQAKPVYESWQSQQEAILEVILRMNNDLFPELSLAEQAKVNLKANEIYRTLLMPETANGKYQAIKRTIEMMFKLNCGDPLRILRRTIELMYDVDSKNSSR
ncbi:hypothetical protein MPSEU_000931800 [Mayamaea pseudoterrestris]|nr:hypothetical protein MPSEU_000931800 [Mayamaea pseudoterrestris]